MATLTLGLTSGPATGTKSYTLSDADVTRWLNALKLLYKEPALTSPQLLAKWADAVVTQAKSQVRRVERDVAEKTARTGIVDITVT